MNRSAKFQLNFAENMSNFRLSDLGDVIGKIPSKFRNYIAIKFNRFNNQEENYDEYSSGSVAPSVASHSTMSRDDRLNDPIVYHSGADTLYNASILSDSASHFHPLKRMYPPPPPPPPAPPHVNFEEINACHYSEFYDKFGDAYASELENAHKFFKNPTAARTELNKYANKKQRNFRY